MLLFALDGCRILSLKFAVLLFFFTAVEYVCNGGKWLLLLVVTVGGFSASICWFVGLVL